VTLAFTETAGATVFRLASTRTLEARPPLFVHESWSSAQSRPIWSIGLQAAPPDFAGVVRRQQRSEALERARSRRAAMARRAAERRRAHPDYPDTTEQTADATEIARGSRLLQWRASDKP
jgi:hypothetical protein